MHAVLERVVSQIAKELGTLDAATTQLHPGGHETEWTAQQVVEHLTLGYELTTHALEVRLNKGRLSRHQTRTWLEWSLQLMILSFGYLPRGVPATEETTPKPDGYPPMDASQLIDRLQQKMAALDAQLDRCKRKFGMEAVAVHPWLGPLRVDQWRRFHALHGLHHAVQIHSIVQRLTAPPVAVRRPSASLAKEMRVPLERPMA